MKWLRWVAGFRTGYFGTEDEEHSGRSTQVTIPENMTAIQSMILVDRRVYAKKIEGTLGISRERVGYIIHEILDIRKLSAKWVLKRLNAGQKNYRVLASQVILDRFRLDPVGLLNHLAIMDETWIHVRI
jgi:hypothetical protein